MSDFLVQSVLRGVLGGRSKKGRHALEYLTGRKGGLRANPGTLLTAAGVAWGIYETLQQPRPAPAGADAGSGSAAAGLQTRPMPISDDVRIMQLAVSAAHADGTLDDRERAAILQQAGPAAAPLVERELAARRPLAAILEDVRDPTQRATLYVLAYTIVRADEAVSGAERIYLAQVANLLGLDAATVQALERDTARRIDAGAQQG